MGGHSVLVQGYAVEVLSRWGAVDPARATAWAVTPFLCRVMPWKYCPGGGPSIQPVRQHGRRSRTAGLSAARWRHKVSGGRSAPGDDIRPFSHSWTVGGPVAAQGFRRSLRARRRHQAVLAQRSRKSARQARNSSGKTRSCGGCRASAWGMIKEVSPPGAQLERQNQILWGMQGFGLGYDQGSQLPTFRYRRGLKPPVVGGAGRSKLPADC